MTPIWGLKLFLDSLVRGSAIASFCIFLLMFPQLDSHDYNAIESCLAVAHVSLQVNTIIFAKNTLDCCKTLRSSWYTVDAKPVRVELEFIWSIQIMIWCFQQTALLLSWGRRIRWRQQQPLQRRRSQPTLYQWWQHRELQRQRRLLDFWFAHLLNEWNVNIVCDQLSICSWICI